MASGIDLDKENGSNNENGGEIDGLGGRTFVLWDDHEVGPGKTS